MNLHRMAAHAYAWGYQDHLHADLDRPLTDTEREHLTEMTEAFADWYTALEPRNRTPHRATLRIAFMEFQRSPEARDLHRLPRYAGQDEATYANVVTYLIDNYHLSAYGVTLTRANAALLVRRHQKRLDESMRMGLYAYVVGDAIADAHDLVPIEVTE